MLKAWKNSVKILPRFFAFWSLLRKITGVKPCFLLPCGEAVDTAGEGGVQCLICCCHAEKREPGLPRLLAARLKKM